MSEPSSGQSSSSSIPRYPKSENAQLPTLDPRSEAGIAASLEAIEESIAVPGMAADDSEVRPAPSRIGPYRLLQVIGEGGFGTVWMADQLEPVKRRVALKIIKPGMDSRAIVARFEQERQALAMMDHPNIARVFDAGAAPDGRPYFVMEYVSGEPITDFCDRHQLNMRQRLELFIPVCEAVQHAHHKGIIHRDIKPGNVLVTSAPNEAPNRIIGAADAQSHAHVKVIDFGVAKAVSHVLTDKTVFTEMGMILGTPEYMSPEQAEMGALDIDTRTDVYALGVLLYELLAGALPFEAKELRSKGYNEIQRIIREVDPPKPSTRLRSLAGDSATAIAKRRQLKLDELEGQLRRELEWIPLKAMRKERNDRYATPVALADDIRNHLAGRPLVAGPESVMYRAKKFVYRNRWGVSAAAMITIALLLGAIVSTIGFVKAAKNEKLARAAAAEARHQAERANQEALRQRQIAIYTRSLLGQANPATGERKDVTVRELIDVSAVLLDHGAQKGQPRVEAALRSMLGQVYQSISMWAESEKQWRIALDLERSAAGADTAEAAYALAGLGHIQLDTGKFDEAEKSLTHALCIQGEQLPADDPQLADTISWLGLLADARADLKTAESRHREALEIYQKHPENVPSIADAMTNLAAVRHKLGDNKQALDLATGALSLRRECFGEEHIDVWNSLINLGALAEAEDDLPRAEESRRQALALAEKLLEPNNRKVIQSISALARTLWLRGGGSLDEAARLQARAIELAGKVDGEKSLLVAQGVDLLGCIARDRGQLPQALELFRKGLEIRTSILTAKHPDTTSSMLNVADVLARSGQSKDAIALATEALDIRKQLFGATHWTVYSATSVLGGAYASAGDYAKAEPMLVDSYKGLENGSVLGKRPRVDAADRLVRMYQKWGKPDEAKRWSERASLAGAVAGP